MLLEERLSTALGSAVTVRGSLPVGFGLRGLKISLADGRILAVKARGSNGHPSLEIEAAMLTELRLHSELPVPGVHFADADLLVMDYIENDGGGISAGMERHAAELIAALHAKAWPCFGYQRDTLIGPLRQPNPKADRWIPFFREHRLLAMAQAAHDEGQLPVALLLRVECLAERLEMYLSEPDHPSLLHGDLWTGNVLVRGGRVAAFVDPAVYCGHAEIELAFTTLFGTFGATFFEVYQTLRPLEPGFHELRCELYNLYPRLVHVRLFGSSYLAGIERTLTKIGL